MLRRLLLENDGIIARVGQVVRNDVENHVQILVLMTGANDANFAIGRPAEELGKVIDDDGDQWQVQISHSRSQSRFLVANVNVMRGQQASNGVDGFHMNIGAPVIKEQLRFEWPI